MQENYKAPIRDYVFIICCWAMLAGFIWSRAVLSVATIGLAAFALFPGYAKPNIRNWLQSKFAVFCLLFFTAHLISGLWSEHLGEWQKDTVTKLSFVAMPLAMLQVSLINNKLKQLFIAGLNALMLLGVCYSLFTVFKDAALYSDAYTIPTTRYNDHIRFGLALVMTLVTAAYMIFEKSEEEVPGLLKVFFIFCSLVFIAYIHYLSARTGLMALYLAVFLFILAKVWQKSKIGSIAILSVCMAGIILAVNFVPRLSQKAAFMKYEYEVWVSGEKENAHLLSDNNRLISYELAAKGIKDNLWLGVGSGDINAEMVSMYRENYPRIPAENILNIPHNQILATALTLGLPMTLILILMLLAPFGLKKKGKIYLIIANIVLIASLQVEAMLEIQFGGFIYLFFVLFWIKILPKKNDSLVKSAS